MELTVKDRYMISNQLRILEKLYPEFAAEYQADRYAVERGYEREYARLVESIDGTPLSAADCRFVCDVLDMYTAINRAEAHHDAVSEGQKHWLVFRGFDGHSESRYMGYVHYLTEDRELWPEHSGKGFGRDSHMPTLAKYDAMLKAWRACDDKWKLDEEDLKRIMGADPDAPIDVVLMDVRVPDESAN